ncbi:hypothetical protein [Burkholderia guangdongensis]|uniref:hypothetical protein n=1 Tax=Burkholderia guangdongensis TaxID=1792500 RepID=UPI001C53AFDA|nr:hypothetical protein [Burkholderia guangdongensis]
MDLLKFEADMEVMRNTSQKLMAETAKLVDESAKLRRERTWMPFVWGATTASAVIGAIVSLSLLFAKMMH